MRIQILAASALLASTAFAMPAMAQDANQDFTGSRVGVIAGYDGIRPGSTEDSDVAGDDQTVSGFLYGIEAGHDFAIGRNGIFGIEAELTDSTGKVNTNTSDPNFFGYGEVGTGRDIYVGARIGTVVAPRTLLYAKAGYTNTNLNVLAYDGSTELDDHFNLDGWRVGAGVERAIGNNAFAKIEYRYSNYTDADFEYANGATTDRFEVDTDRHQVVAGVGIRF